ncbi:hypothetical protein SAMN02745216_00021 [Desulfatibacillum alkenivorans DSM 16219]|uniref:Uncharacterized protein n=1 Tax=Desulfatibacillum alkenivorans DSM 16219 TaxID=1121393 RepID=A0A1M6BLX9_9BACT|nr:hypothetical protein [Desulfatibacillum alkenivorans]SHI49731.1 hypothetical protein SAMN02745216_00021 [Desulfatibacillum alkenivorans DSM 16219]
MRPPYSLQTTDKEKGFFASGGQLPQTEKHASGGKLPQTEKHASGGKLPKTEKHASGGKLFEKSLIKNYSMALRAKAWSDLSLLNGPIGNPAPPVLVFGGRRQSSILPVCGAFFVRARLISKLKMICFPFSRSHGSRGNAYLKQLNSCCFPLAEERLSPSFPNAVIGNPAP